MITLLVIFGFFAPPLAQTSSAPVRGFALVSKQADQAREANRLDDAIRLYRESVRLRPDWKEGWWYAGTLLYDQDRYAEARTALSRFTALAPKVAPGWALLGLCEYQTKAYEEAAVHLERARHLGLAGNPQMNQVVEYHTVLLLTRFKRYEAALEILMGYARRGEEKPALIEAAGIAGLRRPLLPEELPPQDRELVLAVGRAVFDTGARQAAKAQKEFEELVARYPKTPNIHYLFGSFLLIGDPEAGLRELTKELETSPEHVPALLQIVFEYLKRGDAAAGLGYARQAVDLDPKSFVAHNALGRALAESGDLKSGIKELEISKQQAPDSPQTRIALASAYAKAGRSGDAAHERAEFLKLKQLTKTPDEQ